MRAETDQTESMLTESQPAAEPTRFLAGAGYVFIVFVASRLIILAVMALSQMVVAPGPLTPPRGLLFVLTDWDSTWYLGIAQNGYQFRPDGGSWNIAFFPLYPLLIRGLNALCHNAGIAGLVISNICLLAAGLLLNALSNLEFSNRQAREAAVIFLMLNPMSFFFSEVYAESTFLMLAIGALLAARTGHWVTACVCGMFLSATRNVGVLIAIPLLIEFVAQTWNAKEGVRSLIRPRILLLGLIPMGLGLFSLYCHFRFGNYLAFLEAGRGWGRELSTPWKTLTSLPWFPPFSQWLFGAALGAGLILLVAGACLRLRVSYLAYMAALYSLYLCTNHLESIPRYLSVVFPFYLVLGVLVARFRLVYAPLLAGSVVLLTLCAILAANGYWIT